MWYVLLFVRFNNTYYKTHKAHNTQIMQYHIGPIRKFQFLMLPIIAGIFFIALTFLISVNNSTVDFKVYGVIAILFAGLSLLPFLFFINYQKVNKDIILETNTEWFRVRLDGSYYQINYADIESIDEFNNSKVTPWYYCEYWIVKTKDKDFLITSLLISRNDFFVRFPIEEKLHQNPVFLPFVKNNI